jgi:hypothetical protein
VKITIRQTSPAQPSLRAATACWPPRWWFRCQGDGPCDDRPRRVHSAEAVESSPRSWLSRGHGGGVSSVTAVHRRQMSRPPADAAEVFPRSWAPTTSMGRAHGQRDGRRARREEAGGVRLTGKSCARTRATGKGGSRRRAEAAGGRPRADGCAHSLGGTAVGAALTGQKGQRKSEREREVARREREASLG